MTNGSSAGADTSNRGAQIWLTASSSPTTATVLSDQPERLGSIDKISATPPARAPSQNVAKPSKNTFCPGDHKNAIIGRVTTDAHTQGRSSSVGRLAMAAAKTVAPSTITTATLRV